MVIYLFDGTFDGMLTAVFDSFVQKEEPELVCRPEEPLPLFYDKVYTVVTDVAKSERVWRKLSKVISRGALSAFTAAFLTNRPDYPTHAVRFVRRAVVAPPSIENDFSDASVRTPHRNRPDYPTHAARFIRRAVVAPPSIENDFSDASARSPHRNRPDYPTHAAKFIRRAEVAPPSIENDFSDESVLALYRESRRVKSEAHRMLQFVRFQKALDGTYFAMVDPLFDVLPMAISHFRDRFSDQPFIIYDKLRAYGYHFDGKDLHRMTLLTPPTPHPEIPPTAPEILPTDPQISQIGPISPIRPISPTSPLTLPPTVPQISPISPISLISPPPPVPLLPDKLPPSLLDPDELLFQKLWRTYFNAIAIPERTNPRKQRQDMPIRYWKYLPELTPEPLTVPTPPSD